MRIGCCRLAALAGAVVVTSRALAGGGTVERAYGPGFAGLIPDNDAIGFLSVISVDESFPVQSVAVRLYGLNHGYCSDLTLELRRPGVTAPALLATNIRNGNSADFNGDYTFTDTGADLWATANGLTGLDVLPPGDYRASGANGVFVNLNGVFGGIDAQGPWVLRIADDDFLVSGSFTGWEIVLGGAPECRAPGADLNGDGVVDTADLGILLGQFGFTCD
ncbi:MAG: hypothetical protein H6813_03205 [Phycisphaeraceae bacterium]|nr:hypothetical protein [Phycisphaeraceae bacterium]MCB9846953.1 hypothetical protein [Phycisphaeraceae bacterium]